MKLGIITNGNQSIGYGHISRSLIIAQYFSAEKVEVNFYVPLDCLFISRIDEEGFTVKSLADLGDKHNVDVFAKDNITLILIDSIEEDYRRLSYLADAPLLISSITLFLFDSPRFEHISFFPVFKEFEINKIDRTKVYSGKDFFVFNSRYAKYIGKETRRNAKKILITMGGSDPYSLTKMVVEQLIEDDEHEYNIFLSRLSPSYLQVLKMVEKKANFNLHGFSKNFEEAMSDADLIILNGGLTRFEACILGVPFLAISIHSIQFEITKQLTDLGVGVNLGVYKELKKNKLRQEVRNLMKDSSKRLAMSRHMQRLFDLQGAERLFLKLEEAHRIFYEEDNDNSETKD